MIKMRADIYAPMITIGFIYRLGSFMTMEGSRRGELLQGSAGGVSLAAWGMAAGDGDREAEIHFMIDGKWGKHGREMGRIG